MASTDSQNPLRNRDFRSRQFSAEEEKEDDVLGSLEPTLRYLVILLASPSPSLYKLFPLPPSQALD